MQQREEGRAAWDLTSGTPLHTCMNLYMRAHTHTHTHTHTPCILLYLTLSGWTDKQAFL